MEYNFDIIRDRKCTNSIKWNKDAIASIAGCAEAEPFWVADMEFGCFQGAIDRAKEIAECGIFGYPSFPDLKETGAYWLKKRHSWTVDTDDIVFSNGLLHAIALSINLFSKEGDKILIPSPTYKPFRTLTALNNRIMIDYPLFYHDGKFSLCAEKFTKAMEGVDMVLFCSPHNPSGLVFDREDLEKILRKAKELDIPVLSDEIHADLVHPGIRHYPMGMANEGIGAKCITFMAPSKTFNIAGEHSAITIFSDKSMKEKFQHTTDALSLSSPGYLIGELFEEVYRNGYEYNLALCSYLKKNADLIRSYFENELPCLKLTNGDASFVTFIDCSSIYEKVKEKVLSSGEYPEAADGGVLSRFFGHDALVAMNDGTWFGKEYPMFVRFNYGTSSERVLGALERMKRAIRALD